MAVPTRITDLSATAASNPPSGTDTIGTNLDDYYRAAFQIMRGDLSNKGADIASAATTDLGAVQGSSHTITGTVTITSFGTVYAGLWKLLTFSGILTLTNNGTSLILPGAANITTAAGDTCLAESLGSGNWRVHWYFAKAGGVIGTTQSISHSGDITISKAAASMSIDSSGSTASFITLKRGSTQKWRIINEGNVSDDFLIANAADAIVAMRITQTTGAVTFAAGLTVTGTLTGPSTMLSPITASLGADVLLNNTGIYFDGPTIAQGTSGTWFVSGTATITDNNGAANYDIKLHDGTSVIASAGSRTDVIGATASVSLSGYISSPAGNLRISVKDKTSTGGKIAFNSTGNSKDSTISAIRIA